MSNFEQAKARIHRAGQKENCHYIYLVCKGTVDRKVLYALRKKIDLAKMLVDDYRKGRNPFRKAEPRDHKDYAEESDQCVWHCVLPGCVSFVRMLDADESAAIAGVTESVKAYAANLAPAALMDDIPFVDTETGEVIEPLK